MKENDRIQVAEYLNFLNQEVKHACIYGNLKKDSVNPLTCKKLAEICEVTPATITNLSTSSRFCLIHKIAAEILDAYYGYFIWDEAKAKKENPDETIYPRDINYVMMYLTNYYTESWLSF